MATQQFESAKKLILRFTQKNCMNPESDIKGVMPGEYAFTSTQQLHSVRETAACSEHFPDARGGCFTPQLP